MTQLAQTGNVFDTLRRTTANGPEFWSARELMTVLGYDKWQTFNAAIERARAACDNSGQDSRDHFTAASKMVEIGSNSEREVLDYHLTRYACYLTAMNGDPRKPEIAGAQTYFAVRTHEAEQRAAAPALPTSPLALSRALLEALEQQDTRVSAIERRLDSAPITSERVGEVHRLGQQLGQVMGNDAAAWRLFKNRFALASYRDLPNSRFDEAVRFLKVQISAYTGKPLLDVEFVTLQALTLAQPWPAMMLLDDQPKRLENREWMPPRKLIGQYIALHGGRLPSSKKEFAEARAALEWVDEYVFQEEAEGPWDDDSILKVCVPGIYAVARVTEVLTASDDPWFMGTFGWVLGDFVAIDPPVPCRGAQKLWDVPAEALALVRERWKAARQPAPAAVVADLPPDPTPLPEPEAKGKPKELLTPDEQATIRALLCAPGPHRHGCDWVQAGYEHAVKTKDARELLDDLQWVSRHHGAWLEAHDPALLALARALPSDPYLAALTGGVAV